MFYYLENISKDFKIFILTLPELPISELHREISRKKNKTKINACKASNLVGVDELLLNYSIDTSYLINDEPDHNIRQ